MKRLISIVLGLALALSVFGSAPASAQAAAAPPEVSPNCVKMLLIGNSYTYYNGFGEILSRLGGLTGKQLLVVRATKGDRSSLQLLEESKVDYVAWYNGEKLKSGKGSLSDISAIDFGSIDRADRWDYVVNQNNTTKEKTAERDIAMFSAFENKIPDAKCFIIHDTYIQKSVSTSITKEHLKAVIECGCSMISSRALFTHYKDVYPDSVWTADLTVADSPMHPSARAAYLFALTVYAKIYGAEAYPEEAHGTPFIALYNSDGGQASEFITDKYYKRNGTDTSMSVTESDAALLQYLVRANYEESIGEQFFLATEMTIIKAQPKKDGKIITKYALNGMLKSEVPISAPVSVKPAKAAYTYSGKALKPAVIVLDGNKKVIPKANYDIVYSSNVNVGKATVTVKFKGSNYSGALSANFNILPKGSKVKKLTKINKGFTVKWSRPNVKFTGYQLQYSLYKDFKKAKTITVKNPKTVKRTVSKLKSKRVYYVRIRTYKKVGKATYYSEWSTAQKIKTK